MKGLVYTLLLLIKSSLSQYEESEIYYSPPIWEINNPSITVGTIRPFIFREEVDVSYSASATLTAFCQINLINEGLAGPKIKGHFNFKVYEDLSTDRQTIQYFTMKLLENSLYNATTNQPLIAGNNSEKLGVLLHSEAIGNARAGYGVTDFFGIPYLDYGTQGVNGYENDKLRTANFSNTVLYSTRLTQNFTMANAVFELLDFYNWTLVANIFEETTYGSYMLTIVQSQPNSTKTFVCTKQTAPQRLLPTSNFIPNFCACIKTYDKVGVIVIWGEFGYANRVAASIKAQCSGFEDIMFVVADDTDILYVQPAGNFSLQNALWVNSNSPGRFRTFVNDCLNAVSEENELFILRGLVDSYLQLVKKCYIYEARSEGDFKCASSDIIEELRNDTVGSQFFYVADAITSVAEGVYLLQNNCTFLNEKFGAFIESLPNFSKTLLTLIGVDINSNFCEIKTFSPALLSVVTRFVNFTGYTGEVSYNYNTLFRRTKQYLVYSFRDTFFDNELVGSITIDAFKLDTSRVIFPNNNATPVSEIVPDNVALGSAVVDVFFGIFILICVAFLVVLAAYIYYRKEPRLRKNSQNLSYLLIVGCIMVTGGLIISCIDTTDAICIISKFFSYTGIALVFGALAAKNYRIYRIFNNSTSTFVVVPEWKLLLAIGLYCLYFIFLILMLVAAGYGAYTVESESNPFYVFISCRCSSSFWNVFFTIFLTASKALVLMLIAVLAFLNRKIPSSYSETGQIAVVAYIFLSFSIVLGPIYFVMGDNTDSQSLRFAIQSIFCTIGLGAIFFVICLPNLYRVYLDRRVIRRY